MKPEAQRIEIAKACGKATCPEYGWPLDPSDLPDYLNDLNACAEFEQTLKTVSKRFDYLCELERVVGFCSGPGGWDMDTEGLWAVATSTAAQRAEAFLRTIGKWEP